MSVKGDLAYQGLEQLLRADLAGKGGGRLTLRHGAHYAALHLDEAGLYVLSPDLLEPATLLEAFVERGLLDREVLTRLGGGPASAVRVLDQLVADGTLPEAQLLETLALEIEDTVVDMLLWEEGAYRFEIAPFEVSGSGLLARICVDPVGVGERALTRLDQRRTIGDRLGDHALLFEPIAGELPALQGPGDRLHEIYARIDGRTIVHEMALRMGISRFEVLSGIARLADAGLARPVTSDHLSREATERALEGRHAVARALALQWAEVRPEDISPLRKLASLAQEAGDKNAELEALCAQGNLFIQQGEHGQALDVFTRAMRQSPVDDVVLAGMRLAAEAAGDSDALVDGTLLTAQTKLDEGQPAVALELIDPLIASHPGNMAVHLLRARALVQSEKRTEFFEQAEAIGQVLSRDGVKSATDREVAEFFRETIAHLAPDRGDLLERFRSLYDPRLVRRRAMAVLGALVLVLCSAGVYFWPASASSLLTSAQEAADAGDKQAALEMIGQLVDRFPESLEAEQAYRLQALLVPPAKTLNRKQKAMLALKKDLIAKVPALQEALTALPDQAAQATVRSVLEPLQSSMAKAIRRPVLAPTAEALSTTADRLQAAVLERVQVLGETAGANERLADDAIGLREFIEKAERLRDPSWMAEIKGSSELLYGLAKLHGDRAVIMKTQELARATLGLDKAAAYYDGHITRVRLRHAQREIDEADRRCREDAPKLMVSGHLDQADACYARLETLLARYRDDDTYGRLIEGLQRRQLPQLIEDRRAQIEDIRGRLAAAQAAEDAGDLTKAVGLYASLVQEYWLIRFENVCTLPLRVETTPPGARVYIEDIEVGRSPTIVRYAWGSKTSVRVEAEGFVTVTQNLRTAEDEPPTHLHMALAPAPAWSAPTSPRTGTQPLDVAGDILTSDRRGLVTLHARADGAVRWTRDLSSLEGVRARPALADDTLYVARVDGRVFLLDRETGSITKDLKLPRSIGHLATDGRRVAMATTAQEIIVLEGARVAHREPLDALPTAGIVAGHDAFWVGTAAGTVVRFDVAGGNRRVIACTRGTALILAIAATPGGLLVTTSDGALLSLGPTGDTRWKRSSVGDLIGPPAEIAGQAAVIDRKGTVQFFRAQDGEPTRTIDTGGRSDFGLTPAGVVLFVLHNDGTLRAFDPTDGSPLLDYSIGAKGTFPPAAFGPDHVVLPYLGGKLALVPTPRVVKDE